jgi:perosamine synthetase
MLRFVPPAGTPLEVTDILHAWRASLSARGKGKNPLESLRACLGIPHILGASSGRVALWLVLRTLHRLRPERNVVAIPAYTCFSVAASVARAGLKVHPLEMDPATLDVDTSAIENLPKDELLCVLTSNLFGFVSDASFYKKIASETGSFLVDNAAQAFGAVRAGKPAGTAGDVGIYSFGRGKPLAAIEGGAIVTNSDEIALALREELSQLRNSSSLRQARLLAELFAYSALLRPRLYWIAEGMPFLRLGTTEFDPGFPARSLHSLSGELIVHLLDRLEEINQIRIANAASITRSLDECGTLSFPQPATDCRPTMVRLPVIACDERTRTRAVTHLRQAGIGASAFYPSAICDIPGIERYLASGNCHRKKAERLSRTLFTLPVHPFVEQRDIERIVDILGALGVDREPEGVGCREGLSAKRA